MAPYGSQRRGPFGGCALCRRRLLLIRRWRNALWCLLAIGCGGVTAQVPGQGAPTFVVSDLPAGRPLRIVVYGDMRFTDPSNTSDTQPGVRKWLAQKVGEEKPDLLLIT